MPGNSISILRFFAALLIINSHSGLLYPESFSALATGGTIGNSIFFFCSGYTLFFSNRSIGCLKWMLKRLIRIYPSVWLFLLFSKLVLGENYQIIDFIVTPFWFINAIVVFYFLFYWIAKYYENTRIAFLSVVILSFYLLTFFFLNDYSCFVIENTTNASCLHWYYYFFIMMFGAFCAREQLYSKYSGAKLIIWILIYYISKYVIMHFSILSVAQFVIPFFLFPICKYAFETSKSVGKYCNFLPFVSKSVYYVSKLTLDTYIVQFTIIKFFSEVNISLKLLLSLITIILAADILSRVSAICRKNIMKLLNI